MRAANRAPGSVGATFIGCYPHQLGALSSTVDLLEHPAVEVKQIGGHEHLIVRGRDPEAGADLYLVHEIHGGDIYGAAIEADLDLSFRLGIEE